MLNRPIITMNDYFITEQTSLMMKPGSMPKTLGCVPHKHIM